MGVRPIISENKKNTNFKKKFLKIRPGFLWGIWGIRPIISENKKKYKFQEKIFKN